MPAADPDRIIKCVKLGKELPGLKTPPFPTDFGKYLFENVSHEAWQMWLGESIRFINTYRVDLSSREGADFMIKQLKVWLGIEEGEMAQTAWSPAAEDREEGD